MAYRYTWQEIPPSGDPERSRFALGVSPGGFETTEAANLAAAFAHFTEERIKLAERVQPASKTVALKRVVKTKEGYELQERGSVTGPLTVEPRRPARFVKRDLTASAALESFFLGQKAWTGYADSAIWEEMLATSVQLEPDAETLRRLNNDTARAICLRAGLVVHPEKLPR